MASRATRLLGRMGWLVVEAESSMSSFDLIYDKISNCSTAAAEAYAPGPGGPSHLHPPCAIRVQVALLGAPQYFRQDEEWRDGCDCHHSCEWRGSSSSTTWLLHQLQVRPP